MLLGTAGPPPPILRPPATAWGINTNAGVRFGNLWATNSDIQTPSAAAGGNQSQCWNALWNLWATNSDIETPPTTAWGIKANVGMRFGNLRAHLRNPDSPCNRSGESRAMLECFWEPLGHSSDIQTLLATAWGIKANVGMCFGNL